MVAVHTGNANLGIERDVKQKIFCRVMNTFICLNQFPVPGPLRISGLLGSGPLDVLALLDHGIIHILAIPGRGPSVFKPF